MKIMFLNTWGGSLSRSLLQYIAKMQSDIDVFCFSEVYRCTDVDAPPFIPPLNPGHRTFPLCVKLYDVIGGILGETHDGYFTPHMYKHLHDLERSNYAVQYGLAMFVRRSLPVIDFRSGMLVERFSHHYDGKKASRSIQSACIYTERGNYIVAHFHGLWTESGKSDTDERLVQSEKVLRVLNAQSKEQLNLSGQSPRIVLGGDFNLTRETRSLQMLVESEVLGFTGGVCLNSEFEVHDTRTSYYPKEKNTREADFVIVSRDVRVDQFEAPPEPEVSDHRPLIVNCT